MTQILIIDDEPRLRDSLTLLLEANQYEVKTADCGQHALDLLATDRFDLAILDFHLPDKSGMEIMSDLKVRSPDTVVIFITGDGDIDLALTTLKCGAYAYLRKPFEFEELLKTVDHAILQKSLHREKDALIKQLQISENKYRYLIQNSPDIVYTLDVDGNITLISEAVEHLLGYSTADLIGKHFSTLVHEADHDKAKLSFNERRSLHQANSAVELRLNVAKQISDHPRSKPYLIVELKSSGLFETSSSDGTKRRIGSQGIIRDISDRKHYEKIAQATNRFLRIGNRHSEMQPLLEEFVEELIAVSDCCAAAVRIVDRDGRIPYAWSDGFESDFCNVKEPLSVHSQKGMCIRVINNLREPHSSFFTPYGSYYVNSTSEFLSTASEAQRQLMRNTCHRFGYETLALIPIQSGELTIGLIHLADREMNRLDGEKLEILETAALQLGTAIDRVRAEQALKDANEQLEKRVADRTAMLSRAKNNLQTEVEKRKMYEQELLGLQQRLRELSSRLIQTEARERRRIATEIHDRIGQTLAVIKMQLGAIQAEFDVADLRGNIESIREMVSQTISDVRTLTFELSPPILYELGLKAALEWFAESVRKRSGLLVEVEIVGNDRVLDADGRVFLFRTCSELVVNVVKHADAKQASVHILIEEGRITARVVDDGIGFDPTILDSGFDPSERGFGLFSIREQLTYYGGSHRIDSNPNRGSVVKIQLPLKMATQSTEEKSD